MTETTATGELTPRLSDFIRRYTAPILAAWVERVRPFPVAHDLSDVVLRDHIPELLEQIAQVVDTAHDLKPATLGKLPDVHALQRLASGFDLQTASQELAILREVITEMWLSHAQELVRPEEIILLNRSIDVTIVKSVGKFAKSRERTLVALDRVSSAALGTGDLRGFVPRLLTVVLETTEAADIVCLYLAEGDRLRLAASVGLEEEIGLTVRFGEGFAGQVAQSKTPMLVRDASTDPLVKSSALRRRQIHALYAVPLIHEDRIIGVAKVGSQTAYDFSDDDKQLFRAMAQRATSLIVQAQLIESERRAQSERDETLAMLQAVISTAPIGLAFFDEALRFVRVNEAQALTHGTPIADALGKTIDEIIPDLAPPIAPMVQRVFETGQPQLHVEVSGHTRGHAERKVTFLVSCFPVTNAHGVVFLVGAAFVDITELKRQQDLLRERTEFEEQLVGIVSHDLRNPLHAILMSTSLLLQREELDARTTKSIARVQSAAQRANRLIRDLLDFTRARLSGGIPLQRSKLDLHAQAKNVTDEVQMAFPDRQLVLERGGEVIGEWDPDRLAQIIANLTTNAMKYSAPDSTVTVRTRGAGQLAFIEVHNKGAPIAAELIPRLFEPMKRGSSLAPEGLGLGLFIVDQLVKAHGGTIEVKSTAEHGTTFTVKLPLMAADAPPADLRDQGQARAADT
jgi:PAS domain S-box-containing protein